MIILTESGAIINFSNIAKIFIDKENNIMAQDVNSFKSVIASYTTREEAEKNLGEILKSSGEAICSFRDNSIDTSHMRVNSIAAATPTINVDPMKRKSTVNPDFANGALVNRGSLIYISNHYYVSDHAKLRMQERGMDETLVKKYILNPTLAFYNCDGTVMVCISDYEYFIFSYNITFKQYVLVTFAEKSENGVTVYEKRKLALRGNERKE